MNARDRLIDGARQQVADVLQAMREFAPVADDENDPDLIYAVGNVLCSFNSDDAIADARAEVCGDGGQDAVEAVASALVEFQQSCWLGRPRHVSGPAGRLEYALRRLRTFPVRGSGSPPRALPNQQTLPFDGWHEPHESPPPEYAHGALTGQKKDVARWINPNAEDSEARWLDTAVRDGRFWGRRDGRTKWSIWFRSAEQYAQANGRRLAEQR